MSPLLRGDTTTIKDLHDPPSLSEFIQSEPSASAEHHQLYVVATDQYRVENLESAKQIYNQLSQLFPENKILKSIKNLLK